jgi:hypothetical protein
MPLQRSAHRKAAPLVRADASRPSRPRDVGLAAVAAALGLPIAGFDPELAASIERGVRLIGRPGDRVAA